MSLGIGDTLRAARRRLGCSLADASADTRVRETHLAALEQEDFSGLGGDVYVKGFITAYARYLQLDPAPLVDAYRAHAERADEARGHRPRLAVPGGRPAAGERPAGAAALAVLVALLIAALLFFALPRGGDAALALDAPLPPGVAHAG